MLGTSDVRRDLSYRGIDQRKRLQPRLAPTRTFVFQALSINGFLARSETPGVVDGQMSGKGSIVWNDNFLHTQYSLLSVGDNFRDDIGFVKRVGIRKHFADFGIRPRPQALRKYGIRELHPHTRYNIYTDQSNVKVTHTNHVAMSVFFENGANVEFAANPRFERIVTPFQIRPDQAFQAGQYGWTEYNLLVETNHSRMASLSLDLTGGFWSGTEDDQARRDRAAVLSLTIDLALRATTSTCRFRCMPS